MYPPEGDRNLGGQPLAQVTGSRAITGDPTWRHILLRAQVAHPSRLRHQVIFHPPLGPISGQFVLCNLLQVEHGNLGRRAADAAAGGPLDTQQVLGLRGLVLGLLRGLQGEEAKVSNRSHMA